MKKFLPGKKSRAGHQRNPFLSKSFFLHDSRSFFRTSLYVLDVDPFDNNNAREFSNSFLHSNPEPGSPIDDRVTVVFLVVDNFHGVSPFEFFICFLRVPNGAGRLRKGLSAQHGSDR